MARSSNLFGVTVSSKGNVKNGLLSTQPATPLKNYTDQLAAERTLARQLRQSNSTANTATQPCGPAPGDDRDIFAEQGGTLTPEQQARLTPRVRNVPARPVRLLNTPGGQNFGECGPDLRNTAPASQPNTPPIAVSTPSESTYVDPMIDWNNVANNKISGNTFKPVLDSGVGTSPFRPELIMLTDYLPMYQRGGELKLSDTGLFVDVMFQAQKLRQQTLAKLIANIQKSNNQTQADEQFKAVIDKYNKTIATLEKDLSVASEIQRKTAELRKILDLKQIPETEYDSKYFLSLKEFAEEVMQYPKSKIDRFSNTKLLAQLLFDLQSTLENYSVGLLDLTDRDRARDNSPINIDKTYTISNGFSFNLKSLASNQKDINATDILFVNSFMSSLPTKKQEVIKILSVLLCKELVVSKGLGNQEVKKILSTALNTQSNQNIFQSIIGQVGANIFEINPTPGSLASVLVRDAENNQNVKILPFENKYVDTDNNKNVFVPGSSYYADSIFDINSTSPGWNTKPIVDYVTSYANVTDQATNLLSLLLGYDAPSELFPTALIKNIYLEMHQVLSGLINNSEVDRESALLCSVIKLSEQDNRLRNLLFQYVILTGMRMNDSAQENVAFKLLAEELQNVTSLSLVRLNSRSTDDPSNVRLADGERAIGQYLEATAAAIEKQVSKILSSELKRSTAKRQNTVNARNTNDKNPDYFVGNVSAGTVAASLRRSLNTNRTYSFIKSFVDNFERLIIASQENGVNNFLTGGKTNNSGLNVSTLALMFYELCASFYGTYTACTVEETKNGTRITVDLKKNNSNRSALYEIARKSMPIPTYFDIIGSVENIQINPNRRPIGLLASDEADVTVPQQTAKTELYDILIKLSDEQKIPANALYILQTIKAHIRNNATATLNFFQQNKLQDYLVANNVDSDKLEILQNPSQLRVSAHTLDVVKSLTPTEVVVDGQKVGAQTNKLVLTDNLTPNEYSLIKLMMSEKPYLPEANYSPEKQIKLISVGVPAGFSKQLVDRFNVEDVRPTSFLGRQSDIVDVLIYKRDLRFEDIVFKPLRFSFDMSLFIDQQSIDSLSINENMNFERTIESLSIADYPLDSENGFRKKLLTYKNITMDKNSDYDYALPNNADRRSMFKNHVVSYILDMYISLLTGLKVDETTFIQTQSKPERSIDREVFQIMYTYVRDVIDPNFPPLPSLENDAAVSSLIQSILNNPDYPEKAKEYFRLFTYGTIAFNTEYLTALVNQPKIFDRVFHVPVDTSEFEIDLDATLSTESGRQAWQNTYVQDNLTRTQDGFYKVRPKNATDLTFEDYFVRIETSIDKD